MVSKRFAASRGVADGPRMKAACPGTTRACYTFGFVPGLGLAQSDLMVICFFPLLPVNRLFVFLLFLGFYPTNPKRRSGRNYHIKLLQGSALNWWGETLAEHAGKPKLSRSFPRFDISINTGATRQTRLSVQTRTSRQGTRSTLQNTHTIGSSWTWVSWHSTTRPYVNRSPTPGHPDRKC